MDITTRITNNYGHPPMAFYCPPPQHASLLGMVSTKAPVLVSTSARTKNCCPFAASILTTTVLQRPFPNNVVSRCGATKLLGAEQLSEGESSPTDDKISQQEEEQEFLEKELLHLNSLEEMLADLEGNDGGMDAKVADFAEMQNVGSGEDDDEEEEFLLDEEAWMDLFGSPLPDEIDADELQELIMQNDTTSQEEEEQSNTETTSPKASLIPSTDSLESALLQGVVPADAGVGSGSLPGDYGFDPLDLATKDYIGNFQRWAWNLLPSEETQYSFEERPKALILRDYREAEIRHGRLAMLAAMIWPLQEMLDRLLLEDYQFGSIVYGGVTLPYFSLGMTAIMLLLGYLDIYANAIKNMDAVGEAFLPGDCFWDPLRMLDGAPPQMKRNMQERELFNGRMAMLAVAVYIFEEVTTHLPLISIPGNELLFEPAYQVPFIQKWLDSVFATPSPTFTVPNEGAVDFTEAVTELIKQQEGVSPF